MARVGNGEWCFLAVLAGLASCLALANLGNHYLWQDEAQTALIARTVLAHGVPLAFDGRNYLSQESGADHDKAFRWRWHAWLPFYVLAGFFAAFGESTFVARLPFALFGVATVPATYFLARTLWQDRGAAGAAAILLATSVPFLLLVRQCRYYSMAAFFSTVALTAYWHLMRRSRPAGMILVAAVVGLFHSHYIFAVTFLGGIIAHATLWHRDRLRALVGHVLVILLLCGPWIVWVSYTWYGQAYQDLDLAPGRFTHQFQRLVTKLAVHVFSPWLLLVLVVIAGMHVVRGRSGRLLEKSTWCVVSCLLLFAGVHLAAVSWVSPAPWFRYLAPLIPVAMVLVGRMVSALMQYHWLFGILLAGFVISRGRVKDFAYELTHDFDGPIEAIVTYLNEHGGRDDVVAATYGDLPIKFYTGMRVVGGLTGEDLSPALDADWIILRHHQMSLDGRVHKYIEGNVDFTKYEMIVLDAADTPFENREEPDVHLYRTSNFSVPVTILRRIR